MKHICAVMVMALAYLSFGQKNTLLQNVNLLADELKHGLNITEDSLILECERTIFKVEIFNKDFQRSFNINGVKAKIALHDLPAGRFVIEARLVDKLIVLTLLRNHYTQGIDLSDLPEVQSIASSDITSISKTQLLNNTAISARHVEVEEVKQMDAKTVYKSPQCYWVEYSINNGNSSYKTFRFANKTLVDQLILKNQLELKSTTGRLNKLVVWEVYDTKMFLKQQRMQSDLPSANNSEYFNTEPYYTSKSYMTSVSSTF